MMRTALYFPALLFAGLVLSGCEQPAPVQTLDGPTMGSHYSVKLGAVPAGVELKPLHQDIQTLLDDIEQVASTWRKDSELSRFNQAAVGHFPASKTLRELVQLSLWACQETQGALDVTVGPLVDLWGFGPAEAPTTRPTPEVVEAALAQVGCKHLRVDDTGVSKDADIEVDLSAVTQGYAGEQIARLLDARGLQSYLVDMSGELVARGSKPDGEPWRVAVEVPVMGKLMPDAAPESIQKVVTLNGKAIATSGDYRNIRMIDGKFVSHIIDPASGYPVRHGLASVTVFDESMAHADALSTALMVMGPEIGYAFALTKEIPALFVTRESEGFSEKMTPAFRSHVDAMSP